MGSLELEEPVERDVGIGEMLFERRAVHDADLHKEVIGPKAFDGQYTTASRPPFDLVADAVPAQQDGK